VDVVAGRSCPQLDLGIDVKPAKQILGTQSNTWRREDSSCDNSSRSHSMTVTIRGLTSCLRAGCVRSGRRRATGWLGTWTPRPRRPTHPARLAKPSGVCQPLHIHSPMLMGTLGQSYIGSGLHGSGPTFAGRGTGLHLQIMDGLSVVKNTVSYCEPVIILLVLELQLTPFQAIHSTSHSPHFHTLPLELRLGLADEASWL